MQIKVLLILNRMPSKHDIIILEFPQTFFNAKDFLYQKKENN